MNGISASLRLYDSLQRARKLFVPITPDHVRMYVCGPTVYDYAHIGNARPVVVFDLLLRLLRLLYDRVTYVRNITDIDDKIIESAAKNGESIESLTTRTLAAFHEDMAALGAGRPDIEPRATEHIQEMVTMILTLIEKGHAYVVGGSVLFHVPSAKGYGRLSRCDRAHMIAGARVEVATDKKDPADFVLWKPSTPDQPGWESPWGRGRPGWHIECSAMSAAYLGTQFDIHGGGLDLMFPHHENEIAQTCCAYDVADMAQFWLHNGYVTIGGEKMSKSLGNFFTVRELLDQNWPGEVIRLTLLSTHYRQPLDFSEERLTESRNQLDRLYGALRGVADEAEASPDLRPEAVLRPLMDDLNTPAALSGLHEIAHRLNKTKDPDLAKSLRGGGALLGLLRHSPDAWFQRPPAGRPGMGKDSLNKAKKGPPLQSAPPGDDEPITESWIEAQIAARLAARKAGDYDKADRIRAGLKEKGVLLEDHAQATTWKWQS